MDAAGKLVGAWHLTPVKNTDGPIDEQIDNTNTCYIADPENIGRYTRAANAVMRIVSRSENVMVWRQTGFLHCIGFRCMPQSCMH